MYGLDPLLCPITHEGVDYILWLWYDARASDLIPTLNVLSLLSVMSHSSSQVYIDHRVEQLIKFRGLNLATD